jgi:hypothetical protein
MSEANSRRLSAIRASNDRRKKRKRSAVLNITLTDAERDEFRKLCDEHGMLERELLVNSMRAFRTLTRRVELLEARVLLLEAKLESSETEEP